MAVNSRNQPATAPQSKKRVAPGDGGRAQKKRNIDKKDTKAVGKSAPPVPDSRDNKAHRKKPVTAPVEDSDETADEDGDELDDGGRDGFEGGDEMLQEGDDAEAEDTGMEVDNPNGRSGENPALKTARESHKAQKALQQERKANKQHSALLLSAKREWSLVRQKNVSFEERKQHVKKLMDMVRGKVQEIVFKHDASRIIQSIVKYGDSKQRNDIASELKGHYKELAQSKYSKFLVTKLIRLCPIHRASILTEFRSHVIRLLLHREASSVIADSYDLYANAYERTILLQDFYGKEVTLFSHGAGKAAEASEIERVHLRKGLKGALEGADEERRKRILSAMKENLDLVLNNSEKGAVSHAIFHHALREYLDELHGLEDETEREKLRREAFESCQDVVAEMVHTKNGSRVVREFLARGTAKDRKQIVKALRPHIERICKDDDAQLVLFTALDVIDDTKLTAKSLVSEITSRAPALYDNAQGRRALLYLLVPRTTRHFTPAQSALLSESDAIRALTSKKDEALRREEIRKAASSELVSTLLEDAEVAEKVLRDTGGSLLVTEMMLFAECDKAKATDVLTNIIAAPYPSTDSSNPHIIDVPHSSRAIKTILQGGHFSQQTKSIDRAPATEPILVAKSWITNVGKDNTRAMAKHGGTFVVAALCECVKEFGDEEQKRELKSWFGAGFEEELGDELRGRSVLLDAIRLL